MAYSPPNQLFAQLDTNHDGVLSSQEFAAMQGLQSPGAGSFPQNVAMPGLGMYQGQMVPAAQRPLLQVAIPGGYPGSAQMSAQAPCPAVPAQYVGGSTSPMPPAPAALRSVSPCPNFNFTNTQPTRPPPLALPVNGSLSTSPTHQVERTYPRLNDEPTDSFQRAARASQAILPVSVSGSQPGSASTIAGPALASYKDAGGGSPAHEKHRPLRSGSPLPILSKSQMPCLALSVDNVSPANEPERTFARLNEESPEASFEHKIEMLDQKENQLQALQIKMITEQSLAVNREFASMKQFVQDLKAQQEGLQSDMYSVRDSLGLSHSKIDDHTSFLEGLKGPHASADERIKYLESLVGDSFSKHDNLLRSLKTSHEGTQKDVNDIKSVTVHHSGFEERMEYLEKMFGDSFDRHAKDLKALQDSHHKHTKETEDIKAHTIHHASFEQRMEFMEKCVGDNADRHLRDLKQLKDSHDKHVQDMVSVHHASLPERMSYCEKLIGDSADKHAKELSNLKAAHDKHATDVAGLRATQAHHANVEQRLDYIEKVVGDSADKHTHELQALKDSHAKHALELSGMKAAHGNQGRTEDRVTHMEKMIGDTSTKHVQELEAMKAHYNGYMTRIDKQAGSHSSLHSGLKERVDQLEQRLGLTSDNHGNEISNLKESHARYANSSSHHGQELEGIKLTHQQVTAQLRENMRRTQDLESSHAQHKTSLDSAMAHLANGLPMHDRLSQIETLVGDSLDKHGRELNSLRDSHGHHSRVLEGVNLSTKDRLDAIERILSFTTDEKLKQTDEALKHTMTMYEQMRSRPLR